MQKFTEQTTAVATTQGSMLLQQLCYSVIKGFLHPAMDVIYETWAKQYANTCFNKE